MAQDAVLAYHMALELRGKAYSVCEGFVCLTRLASRYVRFRGQGFAVWRFQKKLRDRGQESFGVKLLDRSGLDVRATSLERTLADMLNRLSLSGRWEEIWTSLESIEFFDLDEVVEYTTCLRNATTAANVEFSLEQHKDALMADDAPLERIRLLRPRRPDYVFVHNGQLAGRVVSGWNRAVPVEILERGWEELGVKLSLSLLGDCFLRKPFIN